MTAASGSGGVVAGALLLGEADDLLEGGQGGGHVGVEVAQGGALDGVLEELGGELGVGRERGVALEGRGVKAAAPAARGAGAGGGAAAAAAVVMIAVAAGSSVGERAAVVVPVVSLGGMLLRGGRRVLVQGEGSLQAEMVGVGGLGELAEELFYGGEALFYGVNLAFAVKVGGGLLAMALGRDGGGTRRTAPGEGERRWW